jgi:hypothetical protein
MLAADDQAVILTSAATSVVEQRACRCAQSHLRLGRSDRALRSQEARARAGLLPGQEAEDGRPDRLRVGIELEQDAGSDTLGLAKQAQQDVLRADAAVSEGERLAVRKLEDLLGPRCERDLAGRRLVAPADDQSHPQAHLLECYVQRVERPRGEPLLTKHPEQDVLRADVAVPESSRLALREDDDLASLLAESLEHSALFAVERGAPQGVGLVADPKEQPRRRARQLVEHGKKDVDRLNSGVPRHRRLLLGDGHHSGGLGREDALLGLAWQAGSKSPGTGAGLVQAKAVDLEQLACALHRRQAQE